MRSSETAVRKLLERAARGDQRAMETLFATYRERLKLMVKVRMDPRLAARADASDIVQETLIVAHARLPSYLKERPLPFYPWLRQLAFDQMIRYSRRHLKAKARSVLREEDPGLGLSDASQQELAKRLATIHHQPDKRLERRESHARVREALESLSPEYREVLVLKFLEELSTEEAAAVLKTTESAVRARQLRALEKLHSILRKSGIHEP